VWAYSSYTCPRLLDLVGMFDRLLGALVWVWDVRGKVSPSCVDGVG
jgi:hypothetical protein